jgi:hypothetical protein
MKDHELNKNPMTKRLHVLVHMGTKETYGTQYIRMVGKLLYLTNLKQNISYMVNVSSRFMSNPQEAHLDIVKHIFKYLKGVLQTMGFNTTKEMTMWSKTI